MDRPTVADTMLAAAATFATRSTCTRLAVGAVLARDGRVLSTGYNGAPSGLPHCEHLDDQPCERSVHAEANALLFAARHGVAAQGAHLYLTHSPCAGCAGLIVNAGVDAVTYAIPYRNPYGVQLLDNAGLRVTHHGRASR